MTRLRLVVDTTVLVSAVMWPKSVPGRLVRAILRNHRLLISEETYDELWRTFNKKKFDRYAPLGKRLRFLTTYRLATEMVVVSSRIIACRDPKDDKFLELAIAGRADAIVTGDQDLLVLHPFKKIKIITPRTGIDLLVQLH